jgi:hypothetical protein
MTVSGKAATAMVSARAPEARHCSMCRKAHGAAFSTNAVVPTAALTVTSGADAVAMNCHRAIGIRPRWRLRIYQESNPK